MEQQNQQFSEKIIKQINSSFDVKRLLGTLLSNWYWFVLSISITLTCGFLYLRYTTPQYQMSSSLLIDENSDNVAKTVLSKLDPENDKSQVNLFNEQVILQSQDLLAKVVDSLDLNIRYQAIGRIKETEIYQECPIKLVFDTTGFVGSPVELTIKQSAEGQFEITQGEVSERFLYDTWIRKPYGNFKIEYTDGPLVNKGYLKTTEFIVKIENRDYSIGRIKGMFTVQVNDGRTSLLNLSFTDNIPQRGIDFLSVLIYYYQKKEKENITQKAEKTRQFLRDKKASMINDMQVIDSAIVGIKAENDVINPTAESQQYLVAKTETEDKLNKLYLQKEALQTFKTTVQAPVRGKYPIYSLPALDDPTLTELVRQYNSNAQQRELSASSTGADNPFVKKQDEGLLILRKQILEAIENIDNRLAMLLANAQKNASEVETKMRNTPYVERNIQDAKRGYDVLQSTYLILYQKDIENEISVYAATNKSKIVVLPYANGAPIKPVPKTIYIMTFLLGLLIPGSYLIIREMLNNKVINDHDIETLTQIPIVGSIGRVEAATNRENTIVVGPHIRTGIAEQFRLVRANLEFMATSQNNRVFMVTSSSSGEGKSFLSINLGITMTLAKKRVVIMEFDLRKPKISQYLGLPNDGGISSYLAGMCDIDGVIKASGIHENLYIANCGPIPPNPGELLVLAKTQQLISELQEMFDVIIMDTAPIGLVSDALILSQYAGINLFIVRQSYTVKDQVRMFDVLYKDKKIQNPAIIFNGVEFLKKYGYGYGSGSGYGYSYGYGYGYGYYDEGSKSSKKKNGLLGFFTK
jgi:Mrp family chromosome partitioning ATPase